jgi:hypothetical protein
LDFEEIEILDLDSDFEEVENLDFEVVENLD